jgi:hypothetical protein
MLTEYLHVRQERAPLRRRWFEGGGLELIVWNDEQGGLTGFQLCHNLSDGPHALTWTLDAGYSHSRIDEGDSSPLKNETPVLQPGGQVPWQALAARFATEGVGLEPALREAVASRLAAHD